MPYLTIFLLASTPLALEWLFAKAFPLLWHRPRWVLLPAAAGVVGWYVPLRVLTVVPLVDQALSVFLGLFFGLLVALWGHFRATFWSGPSEAELAMTGRRSLYVEGQPKRR